MEGIAEGWNADEQLQPACCSFQDFGSSVIRPAGICIIGAFALISVH